MSAYLIACTNKESKKTETKSEATATVAFSGPDVDLIKKSLTAFAKGDWETWKTTFADTAIHVHNAWYSDTSVALNMSQMQEGFKKQLELLDGGKLIVGNVIAEVLTMPDGTKIGHRWNEFSWKDKKGKTGKTVVMVASAIKDGKIIFENAIYDTKDFAKIGQ
jgi:hypothetical protein